MKMFCHVISMLLHVKRAFELQRALPFSFQQMLTTPDHVLLFINFIFGRY